MIPETGTEEKDAAARPPASQTLSRGIRALEVLAGSPQPLSIAETAQALELHRSVTYRILRTLEDHSLVVRDDSGRFRPGPGLAVLARNVSRDLRSAALPELTSLADQLGMTAFVVVLDRHECVTLIAVEPHGPDPAVVQRPGSRHPMHAGAPGIAIQSAMSEADWRHFAPTVPYRREAGPARERGYAESHDEVIAGVSSIAAPILLPGDKPAALAVVYIRSDQDEETIGAALRAGAQRIAGELA